MTQHLSKSFLRRRLRCLCDDVIAERADTFDLDFDPVARMECWRVAWRSRVDQIAWFERHVATRPADRLCHAVNQIGGPLLLLHRTVHTESELQIVVVNAPLQ